MEWPGLQDWAGPPLLTVPGPSSTCDHAAVLAKTMCQSHGPTQRSPPAVHGARAPAAHQPAGAPDDCTNAREEARNAARREKRKRQRARQHATHSGSTGRAHLVAEMNSGPARQASNASAGAQAGPGYKQLQQSAASVLPTRRRPHRKPELRNGAAHAAGHAVSHHAPSGAAAVPQVRNKFAGRLKTRQWLLAKSGRNAPAPGDQSGLHGIEAPPPPPGASGSSHVCASCCPVVISYQSVREGPLLQLATI
jgi:hypothetical protein